MTKACTLLTHLTLLMLAGLAGQAAQAQPAKCLVHGHLPPGARLEFLAQGSPDRLTATPSSAGTYSLELVCSRYEVTLIWSNGKRASGFATIAKGDNVVNAEAPSTGKDDPGNVSAQEYDLIADWRVVDQAKHGIDSAKVSLEAELTNGRVEKLSAWVTSGVGDEEKETAEPFETTPDGRVLFRLREARVGWDRVVAIRVTVFPPGPSIRLVRERIVPVLLFSSTGHFHAVYPDQYEIIVP